MAGQRVLGVAVATALAVPVVAQEGDMDALLAKIDSRSGQYGQLTDILQGADPNRALAAFDVMLETGDKSLRETAISAAMTATDERLRARALWETLSQKDSFTIEIDAEDMDEDARATLDQWVGAISTWGITARISETQCLNLYRTGDCQTDYHLSVSGLKVEMRYSNTIQGGFAMTSEGTLAGEVINPSTKAAYSATIQLR